MPSPAAAPGHRKAQPSSQQPNIPKDSATPTRPRCNREAMGRKTAEVTAICCCCPCAAIDILILTAIKLPASICKKALRKRSKRRESKKLMLSNDQEKKREESLENYGAGEEEGAMMMMMMRKKSPEEEVKAKEEEMWGKFHSAGFWRSPSQLSGRKKPNDSFID